MDKATPLNYTLSRATQQPILTTASVKAATPGFEVLGVFNPAACRYGDEILLLLRVAEAPPPTPGWLNVPVMVSDPDGLSRVEVRQFTAPDQPHDPRVVEVDNQTYLTSMSHLRLARSHDGVNFMVEEKPFLFPNRPDEAFGIEDARITQIDDTYWITYTAVSANGPGVGLAKTTNFNQVERVGLVLPPPNKDACLFPERVNGKLLMLHRPMVSDIGKPSVWVCESLDGVHWGNHRYVFGPTDLAWESLKIGAGPPPIRTEAGWLVLYHGAGQQQEYALALALLHTLDPSVVLARSVQPLLLPELTWEREGFFPNVVFSNGWVAAGPGEWLVYYGGADAAIGLARLTQV